MQFVSSSWGGETEAVTDEEVNYLFLALETPVANATADLFAVTTRPPQLGAVTAVLPWPGSELGTAYLLEVTTELGYEGSVAVSLRGSSQVGGLKYTVRPQELVVQTVAYSIKPL